MDTNHDKNPDIENKEDLYKPTTSDLIERDTTT
jgi:hypothetical protein